MDGRCKTCKWWSKPVENDYEGFFAGGRVCDVTFPENDARWFRGEGPSDFDGSVSGMDVVTGPDFGCIHHEEKAGG